MDFNALVRLIFLDKNEITFGVLIGLTLIVVILLLVRSVVEEKESATSGGAGALDSKTISTALEGALKKALASGAVVSAGASADAAGGATGTSEKTAIEAVELKKVLSEREAKIASLLSDLEVLKSQAEAGPGASLKGGGSDGAETAALLAKINELQAKLSEYEIIEDDIADLSSYKEENRKLKDEIEKLRVATTTARDQVQAAQVIATEPVATAQAAQAAVLDVQPLVAEAPASVAASVPTESLAASAAAPASTEATTPTVEAAAPAAPKKPAETFVLDPADDVMGEFAKALSQTSASSEPASEISAVDQFAASLVVSGATTVDPQAAIDALLANPETAPQAAPEPAKAAATETVSAAAETLAATTDATASVAPDAVAETPKVAPPVDEVESPSDPFGALDTEKMLAEVASMGEATGSADSSSVLDEKLDTDRLMAEMGIAEPSAAPAAESAPSVEPTVTAPEPAPAAPAPPPPAAEPTAPPPAAAVSSSAPAAFASSASQIPVDDLLAEFNDTDFQAKKDSKE